MVKKVQSLRARRVCIMTTLNNPLRISTSAIVDRRRRPEHL